MGAEYGSNNTAELTAIGEALLYMTSYVHDDKPVTIYYDSEYAAKSVQGIFKGKKNQALISEIQRILLLAQRKRTVLFEKVKGHSNDYFNDQADLLAKLGCKQCCHIGRYSEINTKSHAAVESKVSV